jgi:hypothetical protein
MVSELANRWPARNPLSCDVTLREDVELHGAAQGVRTMWRSL